MKRKREGIYVQAGGGSESGDKKEVRREEGESRGVVVIEDKKLQRGERV